MSSDTPSSPEEWSEFLADLNESYRSAIQGNLERQATFVEAWTESMQGSFDDESADEAVDAAGRAYEVWMTAAENMLSQVDDSAAGEDVDYEEFRDIWLDAANQSFKELMGTTAFAAASGDAVDSALEFRQELDEANEELLQSMGFATETEILEVGERLVELERRQQSIEEKLDQLLEEN